MNEQQKPLFSFGVVADIQYADKDDGFNENRNQRYREAVGKLQAAVDSFLERKQELSFVLNLGDIVDGRKNEQETKEDLDKVLNILQPLEQHFPIHHVLGNHCLQLPRDVITSRLNLKSGYYTVDLQSGWKLVVLDTTDMSTLKGNPQGWVGKIEALEYLDNHTDIEKYPNSLPWNGGISKAQTSWLQSTLDECASEDKKVLIACHHPIFGCPPRYHIWKEEEILGIVQNYPNVHCILNGHYHPGDYAQINNQHFVTPEAILECPKDNVAFGIVHVFYDKITVEGKGIMTSRQLQL